MVLLVGKKYRCIGNPGGGTHFLPGKVYEVESDGRMKGEYHHFGGWPDRDVIDWLQNVNHWYTFEEVKEMFTLDDIKNGMLVELRNGDRCLVLRNNGCDNAETCVLVSVKQRTAYSMDTYNPNCTHTEDKEYDIVRVINPFCYPYLSDTDYEFSREDHVIFDRSKVEERKRMTVEEIEQQLGYKIAVVDKDGVRHV